MKSIVIFLLFASSALAQRAVVTIDSVARTNATHITASLEVVTDTLTANVRRAGAAAAADLLFARSDTLATYPRDAAVRVAIRDTTSARAPYFWASGVSTVSTGDSVRVTISGLASTDKALVIPLNNAKFATATNQTVTGCAIYAANTLTIFAAASKKVAYYVIR